uniref:non-specific serine/threonine protein kinase n=1 Tax=Cajanus cajan TaxID=3821 RepID=A0A151RB33_CAJCA|nr:LRR receptor-like serine/threonine-protein kinase EFR [Cajanus cajan]
MHLSLEQLRLGGTLTPFIGNLTFLTALNLLNNSFHGEFPQEVGRLLYLQHLNFSLNNFGGSIPSNLSHCTRLIVLAAGANNLRGTIPTWIGNLSSLSRVSFGLNNFIGSIPHEVGLLSSLKSLVLYGNYLSGIVPSSIYNISSLYYFTFTQNHLRGNLPADVGLTLPNIQVFAGGVNNLTGLYSNKLSGTIPTEVFGLSSLSMYFDVSHNALSGTLPAEVSKLHNVGLLVLSENNFSGVIPSSLGSCISLEKLHLQGNSFEGNIPQTLKDLRGLLDIDLSRNNLSGKIPEFLGEFTELKHLNLSYNNFEGEIPKNGIFKNATGISLYGNSKLCGGVPELNFPECTIRKASLLKNFLAPKVAIPIAIASALILVLFLKRSFIDECQARRSIRHRNLLKIITAVSGVDHQGNDFKALVFEFMSNGSLEDWLHPVNNVQYQTKTLTFIQRLNIAIDVACALEYLHHFCEIPIVHCDIKPSNVLLDNDMVAHVGDFGLATFLFEESSKYSTQPVMSANLRGSIGYIPPEYGMGGKPTTLGDIYSYGILLLEIFTGKRPTNEAFEGGAGIHQFVAMALSNHVMDIVDPSLVSEQDFVDENQEIECEERAMKRCYENEGTAKGLVEDCFVSVMQIGVSCSANLPGERMPITVVINNLHAIKNSFIKNKNRA